MCWQDGEGSVAEVNPLALLPILADFIRLKDPGMLTLEVSGLVAKYPDIRSSELFSYCHIFVVRL